MDLTAASSSIAVEAEIERPRVDILVPVWGNRYIEACLTSAVPSLLSPNNLPVMTKGCDVHLVFLTRAADEETICLHPLMPKLSHYVQCDFVAIDDLIADAIYGVVLTHALTRGMIRHGNGMTKIHFILMLSDFLLADGGLAALMEHVLAGRSAIFAPSWRVNDEEVEAHIEDWRDAQGAVTIAPRSLAAVALRNLHPTVIGAMAEAGVLSMAHNNQFYWTVDEHTVIARQLLMHLFCIRPERPIKKVNYYIDYGLFESCCPSGDHVVIGDSDEFMALERQDSWAERERIQWGPADLASVAKDVGSWTTPVHRMLGRYACVLHGTDLPPDAATVMAKSDSFIAALYARLPAALSPFDHIYWQRGSSAWERSRVALDTKAPDRKAARRLGDFRVKMVTRVFGEIPRVTRVHPRWAEFNAIAGVLEDSARSGRTMAFVSSDSPGIFADLLELEVREVQFDAIASGAAAVEFCGSLVILDLNLNQAAALETVLARLNNRKGPAEIVLVLRPRHLFDVAFGNASLQLEVAQAITGVGLESKDTRFVGNASSMVLRSLIRAMVVLAESGSKIGLAYAMLLAIIVLPLSFLSNLYDAKSMKKPRHLGIATTSVFRLVRNST